MSDLPPPPVRKATAILDPACDFASTFVCRCLRPTPNGFLISTFLKWDVSLKWKFFFFYSLQRIDSAAQSAGSGWIKYIDFLIYSEHAQLTQPLFSPDCILAVLCCVLLSKYPLGVNKTMTSSLWECWLLLLEVFFIMIIACFHSVTVLCLFSFCLSTPSRDAKPGVQLPDRCRRAASIQPRSHWQPAKQYGQPDARHDGPVPSNAVVSGTWMIKCLYERQINTSSARRKNCIQFLLLIKWAALEIVVVLKGGRLWLFIRTESEESFFENKVLETHAEQQRCLIRKCPTESLLSAAGFCSTADVPAASVGVLPARTGGSGCRWRAALLQSAPPQPAHHHEVRLHHMFFDVARYSAWALSLVLVFKTTTESRKRRRSDQMFIESQAEWWSSACQRRRNSLSLCRNPIMTLNFSRV